MLYFNRYLINVLKKNNHKLIGCRFGRTEPRGDLFLCFKKLCQFILLFQIYLSFYFTFKTNSVVFFFIINKLMNEFIDIKNNNVSHGIYILYYCTAQLCLARWNKLNRFNRYDHRIIRIENTIIKYKLYNPSDLDNRQTKWQISHDR